MSVYNVGDNYLFIHVPRNAGTSIEKALGIEKTGHAKIERYYEFLNHLSMGLPEFENIFKFAFVRNPYNRFASGYFAQDLKEDISDYVINGDWLDNIFFQPQWRFVCLPASEILMDFIGRYENLKDDWKTVCGVLGISEDLPHTNKSNKRKYKYTERAKNKLRSVYSNDFSKFGYEE